MNIEGLSEETLEKFIDRGYIREFADIYKLERWREEIVVEKGFGDKSFDNIINAIESSRHTNVIRILFSMGILNVGLSNAKIICKEFGYDMDRIRCATEEQLKNIDGVGPIIAKSIVDYFNDEKNNTHLDNLLKELIVEEIKENTNEKIFSNINFVITGSVEHFANRNEVKAKIEELGGKVTGSVTSKTTYLINNDVSSGSSKNKKAKELGIPIITEEEFIKMLP